MGSCPGASTTATDPPISRTATRTCAISVRFPIACNTFGRDDRIRVPSPAASTIERQLLALIGVRNRLWIEWNAGSGALIQRHTRAEKTCGPQAGAESERIFQRAGYRLTIRLVAGHFQTPSVWPALVPPSQRSASFANPRSPHLMHFGAWTNRFLDELVPSAAG
jgi:hypothetical protein